jgi:hypothetical protein
VEGLRGLARWRRTREDEGGVRGAGVAKANLARAPLKDGAGFGGVEDSSAHEASGEAALVRRFGMLCVVIRKGE